MVVDRTDTNIEAPYLRPKGCTEVVTTTQEKARKQNKCLVLIGGGNLEK